MLRNEFWLSFWSGCGVLAALSIFIVVAGFVVALVEVIEEIFQGE